MRPTVFALLAAAAVAGTTLTASAAPGPADARPVVQVDKNSRYKVVYDIHSDVQAAGISRGLYYARGMFEAFRKQGVEPAQIMVHLVLHGDAARMLLTDEAYQMAINDPFAVNPNANIVQDLLALGASVEICHSTMRSMGWKAGDVLPGVTLVHDGYTRLIDLQWNGYAYIGGF